MKCYIALFVMLLVTVASFAEVERDDGYRIEKFVYKARVHADNTWDITETITVNFLKPRHGIYQNINQYAYAWVGPSKKEEKRHTYLTEISNINVEGEKIEISNKDNCRVVRIGDGNKTITGRKTYVIRYTVRYPYDRYKDADFVSHYVLDANWTTSIDSFYYDIWVDKMLPKGFNRNLSLYSHSDWDFVLKNDISLEWDRHRLTGYGANIPYGSDVRLVGYLPNGFWENEVELSDSTPRMLLAITISLFTILLVMLLCYRRRKPKAVTEYEVPDGITSAEVGYIIDNTADVSDLASLIVWWASKGYLMIEEKNDPFDDLISALPTDSPKSEEKKIHSKKVVTLYKLSDLPSDAPQYQKLFWDIFFASDSECWLDKIGTKHNQIMAAIVSLQSSYDNGHQLISYGKLPLLLLILFVIFGFATIMTSSAISEFHLCFEALIWVGAMIYAYYKHISMAGKGVNVAVKDRVRAYAIPVGACLLVNFIMNVDSQNDYLLPLSYIQTILICGCALLPFVSSIVHDTPYRRQMISRLLGFKEFIRGSQWPMLKAMVDENPNYIYEILPYAMVFGLTDKWKELFGSSNASCPSWYETDVQFSAIQHLAFLNVFTNTLNNAITKQIEKSSILPSTYSSRGGCGGGGGGGGGSW